MPRQRPLHAIFFYFKLIYAFTIDIAIEIFILSVDRKSVISEPHCLNVQWKWPVRFEWGPPHSNWDSAKPVDFHAAIVLSHLKHDKAPPNASTRCAIANELIMKFAICKRTNLTSNIVLNERSTITVITSIDKCTGEITEWNVRFWYDFGVLFVLLFIKFFVLLQNQWFISGGKCGICGDSYQARLPRPHENGGTFGRGRIVERYATGQHIDVSVFITANHWGHFKFDLCNLQQSGGQETDACFQKHPLRLADGSNRYRVPNSLTGWFNTTLVLPKDVTCAQCVVRWTYTVGKLVGVSVNLWEIFNVWLISRKLLGILWGRFRRIRLRTTRNLPRMFRCQHHQLNEKLRSG